MDATVGSEIGLVEGVISRKASIAELADDVLLAVALAVVLVTRGVDRATDVTAARLTALYEVDRETVGPVATLITVSSW